MYKKNARRYVRRYVRDGREELKNLSNGIIAIRSLKKFIPLK